MIRRIRRTPQARRDIIAVFTFIYRRSPGAAEKVFDAIERTIKDLAMFAGVGNSWISENPRLRGIRYTTTHGYRNYLIFFKPVGRVVEVYRIVHGGRDLKNVIEEIEL